MEYSARKADRLGAPYLVRPFLFLWCRICKKIPPFFCRAVRCLRPMAHRGMQVCWEHRANWEKKQGKQ